MFIIRDIDPQFIMAIYMGHVLMVPVYCTHLGVDKSGEIHAYYSKPVIGGEAFVSNEGSRILIAKCDYQGDWWSTLSVVEPLKLSKAKR